MPHIGEYVTREYLDHEIGEVYGITENPDGYGETYKMYGILWARGLRTAVHESHLVQTDMGWVVRAGGCQWAG